MKMTANPNGREIFYEGDDPDGFVAQIKREFSFDPSQDEGWNREFDGKPMHMFWCPANLLDDIYDSGRFPMGS
jgi:hypothetical protein